MIQKINVQHIGLPVELTTGLSCSVTFCITQNMVERFAELTGDKSSIHMRGSFARRSAYRRQVVHGMLPVTFIASLKVCNTEDYQCAFQKVSATFAKPVFMGDSLRLTAKLMTFNDEQTEAEMEYSIENVKTSAVVTTGYFTLRYQPIRAHFRPKWVIDTEDLREEMPLDELEEEQLEIQDIEKGLSREFDFSVSKNCCNVLYEILKEGLHNDFRFNFSHWVVKCDTKNLLANCLFSTFVGMCIPGRNATFIDFVSRIARPLDWNTTYTLKGEVGFKSKSTETFILNILIAEKGNLNEVCITGKINARVYEPPTKMPSIEELKERSMGSSLQDKVVLITGASRGIGETTAKMFSLYGAKVIVNYLNGEEEAHSIVKEITENGGEAISLRANVSDRDQVKEMVARACDVFGTVDILVNNAVRDAYPIPFLEQTWEEFQKDIDVVVKGAFNCCQEVIPLMIKSQGGRIINVSTIFTDQPPKHQSKYVVSKSGLVGLSRSLAVEFAGHNIQVNLVVPSIVETDLSKNVPKMFLESMKQETPMKRNATPVDVAKSILFLASDAASFTTGQKIMVTGGKGPFL